MIPLTLRAMNSIPHLQARSSARPSFALLSVLALLALACFPVLAQAEDASGVQYETAVPTVTGHTTPPKGSGGSPADPSNGGATATGSGSYERFRFWVFLGRSIVGERQSKHGQRWRHRPG